MNRVAVVVAAVVALFSSGVLAQSGRVTAQVMPNKGERGASFRVISDSIPAALPIKNNFYGAGGIMDTLVTRSNYVQIFAQGGDLRYAFKVRPTSATTPSSAVNNGAAVDSLALGTRVNITGHPFADSQMVYFSGTSFDNTLYQIVKTGTNFIVINKKYSAYVFASDVCYSAEFGARLYAGSAMTLFGDDVKKFWFASFTKASPCTLHCNHGTSER